MSVPLESGPLRGTRVIDLTTDATAYAGKLLADLGADVVRIEPPSGDPLRRAAPYVTAADGRLVSAAHSFFNAGKRSIVLDLLSCDGRKLFSNLVTRTDIILENFTPGTLASWGLGYHELRKLNHGLILVSITPFGQSGPRSRDRTTDTTLLAAGGLLSLGGYVDSGPVAIPGDQGLLASAIFGAVASLSALLQRQSSKSGKWVDVSGQECVSFALEDAIPEWYLNQNVRLRQGDRAREAGTAVYTCKDGYISMVAGRLGTAKAFEALTMWIAEFDAAAGEELRGEQWRDFNYRRSEEGITRFEEIFARFCKTRGKNELYHEGQARQIAIAPVNTIAELLDNEQLAELNFFQKRFDPEIGRDVTYPGCPYRLQRSPAALRRPAPRSGEHNYEIYKREMGLSENELSALFSARVV